MKLIFDVATNTVVDATNMWVLEVPECFVPNDNMHEMLNDNMREMLKLPQAYRLAEALSEVTLVTQPSVAGDQMLFDLFVTALEGGIGYWSECHRYHWMNTDGSDDLHGFFATIKDTERDGDSPVVTIDRNIILKGYRLATSLFSHKLAWSIERPPLVLGDEWDFDSFDADMIVQLGLYSEVVYG